LLGYEKFNRRVKKAEGKNIKKMQQAKVFARSGLRGVVKRFSSLKVLVVLNYENILITLNKI
jgi:hypothetical protein